MGPKRWTKTDVARLPEGEHQDPGTPGLYVRVHASGTRTVTIRYGGRGQQRRRSVGKLTASFPWDAARAEAKRLLGEAATGGDPSRERQEQRKAVTFAELAERYMRDYVETELKPRTQRDYRGQLDRDILPAFGAMKATDITVSDVDEWAAALKRRAPIQANRQLALLSGIFSRAERWGIRPPGSNPCRPIGRSKEGGIHDPLSADERQALERVLIEAEQHPKGHPDYIQTGAITAIRLLTWTGCRPAEIVTLEWEHVDLEARCLRLPDSKTGERIVPLSRPAVALLRGLNRTSYLVCPNERGNVHQNLGQSWRAVRKRAGITSRLYGLRHSVGSDLLEAGVSLSDIGKLLGHARAQTTERYAKARDTAARRAADALVTARSPEPKRKPRGRRGGT